MIEIIGSIEIMCPAYLVAFAKGFDALSDMLLEPRLLGSMTLKIAIARPTEIVPVITQKYGCFIDVKIVV